MTYKLLFWLVVIFACVLAAAICLLIIGYRPTTGVGS